MSQSALAGAIGLLFNVSATGTPANVSITLCLNGKGALSCQTYNVSALTLSISTVAPNHVYPFTGIKINTLGYSLSNLGLDCTPNDNGYCIFSVNNTDPVSISISKTSGYSISGTISNLTAIGLVLQNNGGDNLTVNSGATTFQCPTPVAYGSSYNVTVLQQPTGLTCTVSNGSGTNVIADITNVAVSCMVTAAYVTNTTSNSVSRCPINPNGSFASCIDLGNPGVTFSGLRSIVLNHAKSLAYVANANSNTVSKCPINPDGTFATCVDSGVGAVFSGPREITLNNAESIAYVVNLSNNTVSKCSTNSNGTFTACADSGNTGVVLSNPRGITLD